MPAFSAMRANAEFRLVLIPFYGILAIFLSALPITAALWFLVSHNVALLWVATTMGYVVAYEWLHLSYHLPESNPWTFVERLLMVKAAVTHSEQQRFFTLFKGSAACVWERARRDGS